MVRFTPNVRRFIPFLLVFDTRTWKFVSGSFRRPLPFDAHDREAPDQGPERSRPQGPKPVSYFSFYVPSLILPRRSGGAGRSIVSPARSVAQGGACICR